jgi:hypothetical protein
MDSAVDSIDFFIAVIRTTMDMNVDEPMLATS